MLFFIAAVNMKVSANVPKKKWRCRHSECVCSMSKLHRLHRATCQTADFNSKWRSSLQRCVHCHHKCTYSWTLRCLAAAGASYWGFKSDINTLTVECEYECVCVLPVEVCDDVFEDLVVDRRKLLHDLPQHLQTLDVVHDFWHTQRREDRRRLTFYTHSLLGNGNYTLWKTKGRDAAKSNSHAVTHTHAHAHALSPVGRNNTSLHHVSLFQNKTGQSVQSQKINRFLYDCSFYNLIKSQQHQTAD